MEKEFKQYMVTGALAVWADAFWDEETENQFLESVGCGSLSRFFDSIDLMDRPVPEMPQEYLAAVGQVAADIEEKWGMSFEDLSTQMQESVEDIFYSALCSAVGLGIGLLDYRNFPKEMKSTPVHADSLAHAYLPEVDFSGFYYIVDGEISSPIGFSCKYGSDKRPLYYDMNYITEEEKFSEFLDLIKEDVKTFEGKYKENLSIFYDYVVVKARNKFPLSENLRIREFFWQKIV